MTGPRTLWWPLSHRGGRLEELDRDESIRLLGSTHIGRLGYLGDGGPRIVPLNFVVAAERVIFRTAPGTEVERLPPDASVAFEVDSFDEFLQTGWSVLVVGALSEVSAETVRTLRDGEIPEPWAEGVRAIFMQIPLTSVSGRRVHPS